ncbi:MAG: hypothetical protein MZV64_01830 [Ignavibacteriales bacterium]|nr:hypothetical protein [Ignavibacteriales bacterium]
MPMATTSSRADSWDWTISVSSTAAPSCPAVGTSINPTAPAWMGFLQSGHARRSRLNWLTENPVYQDLASKFYEHFLGIANAMATAATGDTAFGMTTTD